jgi:pimeloyl-ACP methyl ester carboxylesterase
MSVISELRHPTTRISRLVTGLLALILFFLLATAIVSGILIHQILWPRRNPSGMTVDLLMGHPSSVTFPVPNRGNFEGWFFPGRRGAPTILLCHGYGLQRADILTLETSLQEHQFNVFVFDFSGHGVNAGSTTLGYSETQELLAAVASLARRDDVDRQRFGVWGTDLGAYAAVRAAEADPRIRALAVSSVYDDPSDMLIEEVNRSGLGVIPLVKPLCRFGFRMLNYSHRETPPLSRGISSLDGDAKLFIEVREHPDLAGSTRKLFQLAPEPKVEQEKRVPYVEMSDEEKRSYEDVIVSFFLESLPVMDLP